MTQIWGSAGYDFDEDGIDDVVEFLIARKYAPVLIFDEDEQEDVAVTVLLLRHVSFVVHHSGHSIQYVDVP